MDYDIDFRLLFIQTKFFPGVMFPFLVVANIEIPEESVISFYDWLDKRIQIIRMLETN
ncbi:hypothetical protein LCGC14_1666380 [marine sediment metagenome]|uniref:Uncharacterized protein n=1 Tax=marine sediment metagenome TaxID=412755 RepID=A0A0F9K8E7_9ZZZZ